MKFRSSYDARSYTVKEAVMKRTEASFDNYGAVEQTREEVEEVRKTLGELIELLVDSKMISVNEIEKLIHMKAIEE